MKRFVHLLLLATLAGSVDLELGKTDETFRLFILKRKFKTLEPEGKQMSFSVLTHLFIDVPVQAVILQDKPVLLPLLREVALGVSLSPQPAFAVSSAQGLAGNTPPTERGQRSACSGVAEEGRCGRQKTGEAFTSPSCYFPQS